MLKSNILVAAVLLALASAPACAQSRLFKCKDSKGRTFYTQMPPTECLGLEIDELSRQGMVVKKREAARTPEQLIAREAEEKRRKEEELVAKEERRKNQALLNTYSSEKDIEESRQRALMQAEQATKDIEKRIVEAQRRAKDLVAEKEFYAKKTIPKQLRDEIQNNEIDITGQQVTLAAKKRELGEINAKYDEDKRRYLALTTAKPKSPSGPALTPKK